MSFVSVGLKQCCLIEFSALMGQFCPSPKVWHFWGLCGMSRVFCEHSLPWLVGAHVSQLPCSSSSPGHSPGLMESHTTHNQLNIQPETQGDLLSAFWSPFPSHFSSLVLCPTNFNCLSLPELQSLVLLYYCGILELVEDWKVSCSSPSRSLLDRGFFEAALFNLHGSNCRKFLDSNTSQILFSTNLLPVGLTSTFCSFTE